ncbi:hypothetical protein Ddye_018373 [Dipteronia dyeriana]|uniref:Uncharacterized protein n=1 Tax=Dipteronia dyeriana TaxID=168575 RepID=A0AAD9UB87_9ROSI|nr:hypothetical protein Ddye_018373 [Dipteronia dyeriana]
MAEQFETATGKTLDWVSRYPEKLLKIYYEFLIKGQRPKLDSGSVVLMAADVGVSMEFDLNHSI